MLHTQLPQPSKTNLQPLCFKKISESTDIVVAQNVSVMFMRHEDAQSDGM